MDKDTTSLPPRVPSTMLSDSHALSLFKQCEASNLKIRKLKYQVDYVQNNSFYLLKSIHSPEILISVKFIAIKSTT